MKLRTAVAILCITNFIYACKNDDKDKMISRITKSLGGECTKTMAIGYKTGSNEFRKDIQISIKKSQFLESHFDSLRWPQSNIALIVLDEQGQNLDNFTHLVIKIYKNETLSARIEYPTSELVEVGTYIPLFQEIVNNLNSRDWKIIRGKLHDTFDLSTAVTNQIDELIESACGNINDFSVEGFEFFDSKNEEYSRIRVYGVIKGNKGVTTLSIDFLRKSKKIYGLSFDRKLMSIPYH